MSIRPTTTSFVYSPVKEFEEKKIEIPKMGINLDYKHRHIDDRLIKLIYFVKTYFYDLPRQFFF